MNIYIIKAIKAIFNRAPLSSQTVDVPAILYFDREAYLAGHMKATGPMISASNGSKVSRTCSSS